jgi:hypothetical protein
MLRISSDFMLQDEASEECVIFDIEGDDKRGGGTREGDRREGRVDPVHRPLCPLHPWIVALIS